MSEMALVSSRSVRLEFLRDQKKKGAVYALKLQEKSEQFLSSIQVGITLISFITGFYGGTSVAGYITPLFSWINIPAPYDYQIAVVFSMLLITFFAIVIGELVPKTIALANPEKIAVKVAPTVYFFSKIFYPVVKLLSATTALVNKLLGVKAAKKIMTESELKYIIKDASMSGVIEEEQNIIHEKLFYFSDKKAKHIMTHRSEIEWIDIKLENGDFVRKLLEFKSSKILVCENSLDNYLGVLKVKEFLSKKFQGEEIDILSLLEHPAVFPESVEAQDILNEFKKKQYYFGVVLDEFGSVEGIVTLHDIVESIVGEIPEEEDIVEPDICYREDRSVLVNGDAPIEILPQVIKGMEIDFEEIDYSTVAGFVLENIEKIPEVGDQFEFMGYKIEIVDVDHNRIDKLIISKLPEE